MRNWILLGSTAALAACGSSSSSTTCGPGTNKVGSECVGVDAGSSGNVTCGTGTHLSGDVCVPDMPGPTGAPTIASLSPSHYGISAGGAFQLTGTGFAGADITDLHVYFGDTTPGTGGQLGPCEAAIAAASATQIGGQIPPACNLSVTVTVVTNMGMATTQFNYDTLYAGGGQDNTGDLFIVDPYVGLWADLGPITDGTTNYGVTAIAFASDGTLYGATTGTRTLITINPKTAAATVIGPLQDAGATTTYAIGDMKFSGTHLYGFTARNGTTRGALVEIDPATGTVTPIGTDTVGSQGNGVAVLNGTLYASSAATQGPLETVDTTTGMQTLVANFDYPVDSSMTAMTAFGTILLGAAGYGASLIAIDPATAQTQWIAELPSFEGQSKRIDGIDMAPATLVLAHRLPQLQWHAAPAKAAAAAPCKSLALSSLALTSGAVTLASCNGQTLTLSAADRAHYRLATNRRGQTKLVDTRTGHTVLRDVAAIR